LLKWKERNQSSNTIAIRNSSNFRWSYPGYRPLVYLVQDNIDNEPVDAIDAIKHYASQKLKKNDPTDLYHRGLLIYINLSNTLEVFLYNVHWDVAASLNH